MSDEYAPTNPMVIRDIGDLYEECAKKDKPNTFDNRKRCQFFYCTGMEHNYNLCCIRFFIKKCVLNYKAKTPILSLHTGVIFCEECSANIIGDEHMINTLYHLTKEDDDSNICSYSITIYDNETSHSL